MLCTRNNVDSNKFRKILASFPGSLLLSGESLGTRLIFSIIASYYDDNYILSVVMKMISSWTHNAPDEL